MNPSERIVQRYLLSRGLGAVVYEPDGNVPPDFLVDGRIATEARRLNQNEAASIPGRSYQGLEEQSKPLHTLVNRALAAMGPPIDGQSWFVFYTYRRPLPPWKELDGLVREALQTAQGMRDLEGKEIVVVRRLRLDFTRASDVHAHHFIPAGSSDLDGGGFVVAELARNLELCIAEKTRKVAAFRERYQEWWLVFEDRISYGHLEPRDVEELRRLVQRVEPWSRIILVNPIDPSRGIEL